MFEVSSIVLLQSIVNGLVLGWIYILMALGMSLILSITNILQFAHGEVYMLGAYVAYYFCVVMGFNFYLSILISVLSMALLGLVLERFFFRPLRAEFLPSMIVALGLMIMLQSIVTVGFGINPKAIPSFAPESLELFGMMVGQDRLIAVGISVALTLMLFVFLKKSRYGLALTAAPQNREACVLQGINPDTMSAIAMAIGSGLAAVGGALMGATLVLNTFMGSTALLKGIVIIVLGGMGSLLGVIAGGIILGLVDGVVLVVMGPIAASIAPLLLVVVILVIRPLGLFGHEF
ncbi:MAG: branched-chain amino acid ABC transporter permease [Deltaproteobacteria bacterium]|nr:branched-chain amino acid ABC transporter permease [Deltaproteobacteria bacterium]